jgi:RHH-type rel operon transcriptional repressor/antitoxin RelB
MLAVRISKETEDRLNKLCAKTERTKSYYIKKALEKVLEEEEDFADAVLSYEDYLRSGKKALSLDEMKTKYDIPS